MYTVHLNLLKMVHKFTCIAESKTPNIGNLLQKYSLQVLKPESYSKHWSI
jgi:hypothetical protein